MIRFQCETQTWYCWTRDIFNAQIASVEEKHAVAASHSRLRHAQRLKSGNKTDGALIQNFKLFRIKFC